MRTRFWSSVMPRARLTWRSQVLPKIATTGVPASTRARTLRSSWTGFLAKRVLQGQFGSALEKLLVFGVAARPAALNIINTQLIQLLRNDELVVHGERDGLALSAIAESGVEGRDFHKSSRWGSNLRGRRVTNPPQAASPPPKRLPY